MSHLSDQFLRQVRLLLQLAARFQVPAMDRNMLDRLGLEFDERAVRLFVSYWRLQLQFFHLHPRSAVSLLFPEPPVLIQECLWQL